MGKFKDEAAGKPIIEFVSLKSKMYSYKKKMIFQLAKSQKVSKRMSSKETSIIKII